MNELLQLALDAHGGLEAWQAARRLHVDLKLTGGLYRLKGQAEGYGPTRMTVDLSKPDVSSSPYPIAGQTAMFSPERGAIVDATGAVLEERVEPRKELEGIPREQAWTAMEAMTFTSYAMWNYLVTPLLFTFRGFETKEVRPHIENGETWRVLHVQFPDNIPTHSKEQLFYFSEAGLLQRLDYHAVGPASHYCYDHRQFNGLTFPTLRRVVLRTDDKAQLSGPTAVLIQISNIVVE